MFPDHHSQATRSDKYRKASPTALLRVLSPLQQDSRSIGHAHACVHPETARQESTRSATEDRRVARRHLLPAAEA
eukprot:1180604-Prorocentrum_minimum.AAC.2